MTDPGGFYRDGRRLHDTQSQSTIFCFKNLLMKETEYSFKLFDDVFQSFRLKGMNNQEYQLEERNEEKIT